MIRSAAEWLEHGARRIAGIAAAMLPRRMWGALEPQFPVTSSAILASLLTFFAGAVVGIPGFFEHAGFQSRLYIDLLVGAADTGQRVTRDLAVGMNAVALFTFLLLTPKGWATMYLCGTGFVRFTAAWFDDPHGDAILSLADAGALALARRTRSRRAVRARETLEGPPTRDIVVSGARAAIPDADLVIIASRRKPGWDHGTIVMTDEATYRVGTIIERTIDGRLRTLYPLTEHKDFETFRRTVRYEMPKGPLKTPNPQLPT